MGISTKIITDFSHLLELESAWNRELVNYVENPFLYSRLFGGFMHFGMQIVGLLWCLLSNVITELLEWRL